jgi:hypothetical protein
MSGRCSFLAYDSIDAILAERNLSHMRASIIEDYEEWFDCQQRAENRRKPAV